MNSVETVKPALEEKTSVFSINLNLQNEQYDLVLNYLKEKKPDYIVLLELTSGWAQHLKELSVIYPHAYAHPRDDNFGIGIMSRHPIRNPQIHYEESTNTPFLIVSSKSIQNELSLVAVHPFPPIGQIGTRSRDNYLTTVARIISKMPGTKIVCGDFNTTPWSSIFRKFIKLSNLEHFRGSFINTWPTHFFPLGIPIDHCLGSNDILMTKYSKGPFIGSDHYPIEIEFETTNLRTTFKSW